MTSLSLALFLAFEAWQPFDPTRRLMRIFARANSIWDAATDMILFVFSLSVVNL